MRSQVLEESTFENSDQIYTAKVETIKRRTKHGIIALTMFLLLALGIAIYRYYITKDIVADGRFYDRIWEGKQILEQQTGEEGSLAVSKAQLGKMAWTIMHMSTGMFPSQFSSILVDKFNIFIFLFGQLYPCKSCRGTFLKLLKEVGPFTGSSKQAIMVYLCTIHNKLNEQLGKPLHDCSNVKNEWNACGCEDE